MIRGSHMQVAATRLPTRIFHLCIAIALGFLCACATVGIDPDDVRAPGDRAFDKALVDYAAGNLRQAQVNTLAALEDNPLDARAVDLLRAILKEKGLIDEAKIISDASLPEFTPTSPSELVRVISGRNPAVREAVFSVIEARAELREANVDMGPEISVLTRFYPLGILARMTQSLYGGWWERKAKMSAAEAAIIAALANYGRVREEVNRESLLAYLDAVAARERLASFEREADLLREQHEQSTVLVSYGRKLPRESLVARREIGALQYERTATRQQLATAKARLNALMNRRPTAPISITAQGLLWRPPDSLDDALTAAYVNRFEIDEAQARMRTAEARKTLAAMEDPKIDLYATYGGSGEGNETRFIKGFSIGAITRFPLAIIPLKRAREDQNNAIIRQLELRGQQVRNEIAVEVVDAYHSWDTSRAQLSEERMALVVAREDRRVAQVKSKAEVAEDPLALNWAEIDFIRAERATLERRYGVQRSLVELGTVVGTDLRKIRFVSDQPDEWTTTMYSGPAESSVRALWVWRARFLERDEEAQFFVDILQARGIGTVFLYVTVNDLVARAEKLGRFLALANRADVQVQALNGEPDWLLAGRRDFAARFADQVIKFNARNPRERQFSAIHLDVEPHALDGWERSDRREELVFAYIELLDGLKPARESLPLIVDIPVWFVDRELDGIRLSDIAVRRSDGVVYMAYGTQVARRSQLIGRITEQADGDSNRFWIGISADRSHLCPHPLAENFEADIHSLESSLKVVGAFAGVAIHDFDRYRDLILGVEKYGPRSDRAGCLQAGRASVKSG